MMHKRTRRCWELIVLLAALACVGSWAAGEVRSMQDRSEVAKMTEQMKTVCVGRYLVDVPAQAEVIFSQEKIAGFAIETVDEDEAAFRQRVAAREAVIAAKGAAAEGTGGVVEARDLRVPGMIGRTLVYGRNRGYLVEGNRRVEDEYVSVEAHAHMGGLSVSLSAQYADEARAQLAEALLARLKLRGEDEIPSTQGFCIWRAQFAEPLPVSKAEHAVMHLALPGHPDLALTFFSMPGGGSEPNLLARSARTDVSMGPDVLLRMTKLRATKRNINGIDGEELVMRAREYNLTTTYGLNWESRGAEGSVLQPYLSLELQTGLSDRPGGKSVDTSLREDALLELWDCIASTIRLRKSDQPSPHVPASEPPGPKLGAIVSAGELCPQTGWWRCDAVGPGFDVQGGQVQYFRKGERIPQALLLPRQSLWQKIRGLQPSVESRQRTAWKLVDKRQRARKMPVVPLALPGSSDGEPELEPNFSRAATIGTYVRTGDPCPASGWWRCDDPNALDGARWFARGSLLPTATFHLPGGVFARPGGPEFIQRRSGWQLARHAEAPAPARAGSPLSAGSAIDEPPALV